MEDESMVIRRVAIETLYQIGVTDNSCVLEVTKSLAVKDPIIRLAAAMTLWRNGKEEKRASEVIEASLISDDAAVRLYGGVGLARIGRPNETLALFGREIQMRCPGARDEVLKMAIQLYHEGKMDGKFIIDNRLYGSPQTRLMIGQIRKKFDNKMADEQKAVP